jgi:hypothetical protein
MTNWDIYLGKIIASMQYIHGGIQAIVRMLGGLQAGEFWQAIKACAISS